MKHENQEHLSQISTLWDELFRVNDPGRTANEDILGQLLQRYHHAVYRYLVAVTGRDDVAADLFQDFAVKFLDGKITRVDPAKGRFRDYLKITLINLIRKNWNRTTNIISTTNSALELVLPEQEETALESEELFLQGWRKTLLDRTWESLAAAESRTGTPYWTTLKIHSEHPGESSQQLAQRLTEQLRPTQPFTDGGVRKLVQRARKMMSDSLLEEVARSIPSDDLNIIEDEVIALGFHAHCKQALAERRVPHAGTKRSEATR